MELLASGEEMLPLTANIPPVRLHLSRDGIDQTDIDDERLYPLAASLVFIFVFLRILLIVIPDRKFDGSKNEDGAFYQPWSK